MSNPIEKLLIPKKDKKKKKVKMNQIFNNVKNNKIVNIKVIEEDTTINSGEKQKKYNQFIQDHRNLI
tara:strand:- start:6151 stop:6351 length:201 start_codon:yes stop_codon:yes gene_type:complete